MRKVDVLRELQAVDSALDQLRARNARVVAEWGRREELERVSAARDAAQEALRHRRGEQRDLELDLDRVRGKLKTNSDKLYSGRVGNPRELSDLSAEVDQDRRHVSEREDRLLALFEVVESAQAAAQQAEQRYTEAEAAWKREQLGLAASKREIDAEAAKLLARRNEILPRVDAASLRLYDNLRRTRGGLAVVAVKQRTCQGCRVTLPSSEEQRARTSEALVTCNSCNRILYAAS